MARIVFFLLFLLAIQVPHCRAGGSEPEQIDPDTEQRDIYYDAMIRSIELDLNRWKSFSRSVESGPWFYDTQGLRRKGKTVVVPVTVYPHPKRTELYRSVFADHGRIRKIVFTTEIDCSKKSYRQPEIQVYGYDRELLAEHLNRDPKAAFTPIKPGTTTDTLRGNVCPPERKKR